MAVLYTLVYIFLILGGGQPYTPWLAIPTELYYRYNVLVCASTMLLGWILAVGVVQLLGHGLLAKGSFEQSLISIGFGIGVASLATGIHDLLSSFLGALHLNDQRNYELSLNSPTPWRTLLWTLMALCLLWFVVLFSKGLQSAHELTKWKALLLGIVAFFVYQLFFFVFNR